MSKGTMYGMFSLHKIKSKWLRRAAICVTGPLLFVGNIGFSALAFTLFWWRNQDELFNTAKHYWHTSARYDSSVATQAKE